jgi:hypothetical protein
MSYKKQVTVKEQTMTKRELINAAHVRNEQFIDEFKSITELLLLLCLGQEMRIQATSGEQTTDEETVKKISQIEVLLAKLVVDRLEALVDNWPNAVWFFFPETGPTGWIRLTHQFRCRIFPSHFPETPQPSRWRTKRVRGYRWCGIARRIRRESDRTFRIWDQFKMGLSPMQIVRREFPSRRTEAEKKSKKELMIVHRSLERATQLIYGQPLPRNRKFRRLLGFNHENHLAACVQCLYARNDKEFCQKAQDFVNQDQKSGPMGI